MDETTTSATGGPGRQYLEAACENAWDNAKEDGDGRVDYKVETIGFEAENPIHSYIVIITPDG